MPKAIREVYGETLVQLGAECPDIVALDADVSSSTKSALFGKAHPERFFNMGIAESNMTATAAGLAAVGKIPFVNAFTAFLTTLGLLATRAQICYGNLNVKLAAGHAGLSGGQDGATHHSTEDLAVMRALPNMCVIVPGDAACTRWATRWAALEHKGPVYLRLNREAYPDLYDEEMEFAPGRGCIVRDGRDVTVIACGILVHSALAAAEELENDGVSVRVVDMYSIKPIDESLIVDCARETGAIVTAEEHSVIGGLGGAVAEVLARHGCAAPTEFVGVQDVFTESGVYGDLLAKYGLDKGGVKCGIKSVLNRKY